MADVREPDAFQDLLERARKARAAKESADAEWAAVAAELDELTRAGDLSADQAGAVAELLAEEPAETPHHRRRWGPAPS